VLTSRTRNALLANFTAFERDFVRGGLGCRQISGALYALLLDEYRIHWKEDLTAESDLGAILQNALGIVPILDIETINKSRYDHAAIIEDETTYIETTEQINILLSEIEGFPLLKIYWENLTEPWGASPAPPLRADIPSLGQVSIGEAIFGGNFGRFDIDGLFIMHNDGFIAVVAENIEIGESLVTAETWTLSLMDGYEIVPHGENFQIVRRAH
jgi:hypothetical protein